VCPNYSARWEFRLSAVGIVGVVSYLVTGRRNDPSRWNGFDAAAWRDVVWGEAADPVEALRCE